MKKTKLVEHKIKKNMIKNIIQYFIKLFCKHKWKEHTKCNGKYHVDEILICRHCGEIKELRYWHTLIEEE